MIVHRLPVGKLQENCYIIVDEVTKKAALIDPGAEAKYIEEKLNTLEVKLDAIILTHCHFDHNGAVDELKEKHGVKVYVSEVEYSYVTKDSSGLFGKMTSEVEFIEDGEDVEVGSLKIKAIFTPGHSKGGVSYLVENSLFSGDTLFRETIGRTDLLGSSYEEILDSINNKLMLLNDNVEVYPGHGDSSTIGHERHNNPFVS